MSRWHKFFLLVGFIAICGAIYFIVYFYVQFNRPVNGTVSVGQQSSTMPLSSVDLTPVCTASPYIVYCHPKGLALQPSQPLQSKQLALVTYSARDIQTWLLGIEIDSGTGSLSDDSAYTLRERNPAEYLESRMVIHGQSIDIMQDKYAAGFSKVAFLIHGNYTATASLSGNDQHGTQPLANTFMMVLQSWRWQ